MQTRLQRFIQDHAFDTAVKAGCKASSKGLPNFASLVNCLELGGTINRGAQGA
jgi:hypothetical protein